MAALKPSSRRSKPNPAAKSRYQAVEARLLDAGARTQENLVRETDQRLWLRWLAVGVTLLVMALITLVPDYASRLLEQNDLLKESPVHFIALLLGPVASLTTLTIALLVAAFRGYKDADENKTAKTAANVARSGGIVN